MNYGAFGLVEVVGSSNAILVIDQMLKTADVSFLTWNGKCFFSYLADEVWWSCHCFSDW